MSKPENVDILDWSSPTDKDNPFNWPLSRKVLINILCLLATLSCNANATALTVAWKETNPVYGISDDTFPNSYWAVTSWTLGGVLFMAFILPLIEDYSVRWGYLVAYGTFIIFTVPQGAVTNFAGFLVLRFFAGGCVSLVANCIVGISCDMYVGERGRNIPVAAFITAYLAGAAIGPVIGAAILSRLHWTWIIWIQSIWHTVLLILIAIVLKESRGVIILRRRAQAIRKSGSRLVYAEGELDSLSPVDNFKIAIKRPIWLFLTEYVVFTFTLWSAFAVGMVYLFTQSTEIVFESLYDWSSIQCGYVQGATAIGMVLSFFANFISRHLYFASASRNTEEPGQPIPEAHLYVPIFGSFVGVLGGMFVYGWTAYSSLPWIAAAIGLAMVGFGINSVVTAVTLYITACYSKFAISACAAVGAGENIFAAFLPLAAMSMYRTLGLHWPSSILGILSIPLGLAPVIMLFYGSAIRKKSPFILEARYGGKDMGMDSVEDLAGKDEAEA